MDSLWWQVWILLITCTGIIQGQDPCSSYVNMTMYNGRRSADYQTGLADIPICDYQKYVANSWLRFEHPTGREVHDVCMASGRCGTDLPMWINGSHPDGVRETVARTLCVGYRDDCCYWSTKVQVHRCSGDFFLYQVPALPGCDMSFCMKPLEACEEGYTWNYVNGVCDQGNRKPNLKSGTTFWKLLDQKMETTLQVEDPDEDSVTVSLYYPAVDGVTLYYNGYFSVEAELKDNITVTIQLTDTKKATNVYNLTVYQIECPCQHGGSCVQQDVHSRAWTCQCKDKYFGDKCERLPTTCNGLDCYGICVSSRCECEGDGYNEHCLPTTKGATTTTTTTARVPTTMKPWTRSTTTEVEVGYGSTTTRSASLGSNMGGLIGGITATCSVILVLAVIIIWQCFGRKKTGPSDIYKTPVQNQFTGTPNPAYQDVSVIKLNNGIPDDPPPSYDSHHYEPLYTTNVSVGIYEELQDRKN